MANNELKLHIAARTAMMHAAVVLTNLGDARNQTLASEDVALIQARLADLNRAFIETGLLAAPAQGGLSDALPEGFQRLETVKFWADAFADDPQRVAGAMIVKLLNEYVQLRELFDRGQQGGVSDATLLDWLDGDEFVALNCYVAVYDEHGQPLEKERKHYLIERESSIATVEAPTVREAIRAAIQAQAGDARKGDVRG